MIVDEYLEDGAVHLTNATNNSSEVTIEENGQVPVEDLFATLLQIFLTIKLGWLTGYFKVISKEQGRGLDIFVGKYALPVLIFTSLARLDFSQIEWSFLIGIAITKASIFVVVFLGEFLLNKPRAFSRPAIFAILCTQTNDFGMGLPILESVYGKEHKYIGLLYLVGPISLLILNPIGFTFLETEKSVKEGNSTVGIKNKIKIIIKILRGLLMNPIVNMTLLGVIANFALDKQLPGWLDKFLGALGNTFTSLAPFALGLNMVGKLNNLRGGNLKTIISLLVMKGLATPLLCHIIIEQAGYLLNGKYSPELSNYGVLYGFIPPALGVDSYASLYRVNPELVSGSIVIITVMSAPMMYLSAQILTVLDLDGEVLESGLNKYIMDISTVSVIGVIFIIAIFVVSRRFMKMPHLMTMTLLLFSLESGVGGIMRATADAPLGSPLKYAETFLSYHGVYGGKISVTILSAILYFYLKGHCKVIEKYKVLLILISPVLSSLITSILLLVFHTDDDMYLNFGSGHDIFDLVLDLICFIILGVFLAMATRLDQKKRQELSDYETPFALSKCEERHHTYTPQLFRHFLLLKIYCGSFFSNLTLNIFRCCSFFEGATAPGLYKVLVYIDLFLWTGQGLVLLSIFAFDCTYILNPVAQLIRWMKRKIRGSHPIIPPSPTPSQTTQIETA